jgi:hypothetical protein
MQASCAASMQRHCGFHVPGRAVCWLQAVLLLGEMGFLLAAGSVVAVAAAGAVELPKGHASTLCCEHAAPLLFEKLPCVHALVRLAAGCR